jgi:hypothetical protein
MFALIHYAESSNIIKQKGSNPFPRVKPKEIPHAPHSNFLNFVPIYFVPKFIIKFCNKHGGTTWQLGIGLLVLQQLSGINAVLFYASSIFKAAGMLYSLLVNFLQCM